MSAGLTRIVARAQQLLAEVLAPGALAVDLTAGTGRDTLFLFQQVGPEGCVVAFDVQDAALDGTSQLLTAAGARVMRHELPPRPQSFSPGVHLLHCGHEHLAATLAAAPAAIVANLGYLPGGDAVLTTTAATTLCALTQALAVLAPGGRLAVVAYVEHPGGRAEADAVAALFATLAPSVWQVLRLEVANLPHAPFLLVAQKKAPVDFPRKGAKR